MAINIKNYEKNTRRAVRAFWRNRQAANEKQKATGTRDSGERGSVTSGKNMNGFVELIVDIVSKNGLKNASIFQDRALLTLPGFYRPTKVWDLVVIYKGELIAAIELKSQVGPSFGNNFNNRVEEAIGAAKDIWTAYREGAFGDQPRPFVGWMMLVEDTDKSRSPVKITSPHFAVFKEFNEASYQERYRIFCQKLIMEKMYDAASVITSPRKAISTGKYIELSQLTGIETFIATLAGHISAVSTRLK